MQFASTLLIQSVIVGLAAALGAALAVIRWRSLPVETFEEHQALSLRGLPFVW